MASRGAGVDFPTLEGIDHIEFYVGNAKQAAYYYRWAYGFSPVAYSGMETGVRDRVSYVLAQQDIRFVLSTPLSPQHPMAEHVQRHGDGVRDVALRVANAEAAYQEAIKRGARGILEPTTTSDEFGILRRATVATFGDTVHSFIERAQYNGPFAPGYRRLEGQVEPVGLKSVDHVVGNVEQGKMDEWVDFYRRTMDFELFISFDDKDISTAYSALKSKVVQDRTERVKLPINEPATGRKKSQIQEYLDFYLAPGVQHIAMLTDDIVDSVSRLRARDVEFMKAPGSYYDTLLERVGPIDEDLNDLRGLHILVDRDDEGYLLQIFTRPVEDRPTLFLEVIQRKGCRGFGKGNFKALFEAVEREQEARGNL